MLNTVIHGDCLQVMATMETGSVGIVVTSPPYNLRNSTGSGTHNPGRSAKWTNSAYLRQQGYDDYDDNRPEQEYQDWLAAVMTQVMRVLAEDGAAFVVFKERVQNGLIQDRRQAWDRFPLRQTIIWSRPKGINFNAGYFVPSHEQILLFARPAFRLAPGANGLGTVWTIPPARDNPHPAPFPDELARRCIQSCPDNGPVLDPFLGSGTTALAAEELDRTWIGIEQSARYCRMAEGKLEEQRQRRQASTEGRPPASPQQQEQETR